MKALAIGLVTLLAAQGAAAQDAPRTYSATFYGWFPGMTTSVETSVGTIESETSASDSLSALDMAFMGTLGAKKGRWGFVGDLLYVDLSNTADTPLALYGDARVEVAATALSGYALYRVTTGPALVLDVGAGFRALDHDVDLHLSSGSLPGVSQDLSDNWVDPLIPARLALPIGAGQAVATRPGRSSGRSSMCSPKTGRRNLATATWTSARRSTAARCLWT